MDMSEFDGSRTTGYKVALGGVKGLLRIVLVLLVIVTLIYLGRTAYSLGYEAFSQRPVSSEAKAKESTVRINSDMTAGEVWELLYSAGLIRESQRAFELQARLYDFGDFVPGRYTLNTAMTINEMLEILTTEPEEED